MNAWAASAGAIVLGILAGIGVTMWEFRAEGPPVLASPGPDGASPNPAAAGSSGQSKVVIVGGERYDFGVMQRGETGKHTFIVKNTGRAPLTLTLGKPTCQCTSATLALASLDPGQETELKLEWEPKSYAESFSQGVDLKTNDPGRPVIPISIIGRVVQAARPIPDELNVGRLTASAPAHYSTLIFCYRNEPFSITKIDFEHADEAEYFDCRTEPFTDAAVLAQQNAKSAVKLDVTVKPGLPLGPIHQTIRLTTSLADIAPLELPIRGTAVSDVSFVAGANFDPEHNLLSLGGVSGTEGKTAVLHVSVKGDGAGEVQVKIAHTFPNMLQAELGEPKATQNGTNVLRKLTLRIPPGSPPANHLGSETSKLGRVEIETTHPSAKKITLYVQFAVE